MADKRVPSRHNSDLEDNSENAYQRKRRCERAAATKVITKEFLLAAQNDDLSKVVDVLGLQPRHARALLIFHRWDVDNLLQKVLDKGEEAVFTEARLPYAAAGISAASSSSESMSQANSPESSAVVKCGSCLEEALPKPSTRMDCGHSFCDECWTEYFIVKIKEGRSRQLTCMEYKCGAICDEDQVRRLVGSKDSETISFYERFLLESYIEDNSKVQWCPSIPPCGNAIRVELERFCEVQCTCGQQFCFNCLEEPHSPCSCAMWKMWQKKPGLPSKNGNLHTVITRPCPKCHTLVEKDGGCNRMLCRCGQHFCWLCGLKSEGPLGCACGRCSESEEKDKEEARSERESNSRFLHYHYQWQKHMDAMQFMEKLKRKTRDLSVKKCRLGDPLQILFLARRALSFSFVFAYYMFGNHLFKDEISEEKNKLNQNLFEDLQKQMEKTVERLTQLVETLLDHRTDSNTEENMSGEVRNLTSVLDEVCKNLHDVIANDLLGSLQVSTHFIAPYKSPGDERRNSLAG